MNKAEVIQVFEDAIKNNNQFIGLMIEKAGAGPEITVVPEKNFIRKRRYLIKAYNTEMVNTRDPEVRITGAWPITYEDVCGILPSGG